jgi:WD40 repeat protein
MASKVRPQHWRLSAYGLLLALECVLALLASASGQRERRPKPKPALGLAHKPLHCRAMAVSAITERSLGAGQLPSNRSMPANMRPAAIRCLKGCLFLLGPVCALSHSEALPPTGGARAQQSQPVLELERRLQAPFVPRAIFSTDGNILFAWGPCEVAHAWDVKSGKLIRIVPASEADKQNASEAEKYYPGPFCLSPDSRYSIQGWDRDLGGVRQKDEVLIRELFTGQIAKRLLISKSAEAVACHPSGKVFATAEEGMVRVWSFPACKEVKHLQLYRLRGHEPTGIDSLAFVPPGPKLLILSGRGLELWDLKGGKVTPLLDCAEADIIYPLIAASSDGKLVAAWIYQDKSFSCVRLWNPATGKKLFDLKQREEVFQPTFHPDGRHLLGVTDKDVVCWDLNERRRVAIWKIPPRVQWGSRKQAPDGVVSIALSPQGDRLATGHVDGTVRIWRLRLPKHR